MNLIEHLRPGVVILEPRDRLTAETEEDFTAAVRRHLDAGRVRFVLDLAHVPYIDSRGLGAMAHAYVSAWRRGGGVKLLSVAGRNRRLLTVTRLIDVFESYESADAAVDSFMVRRTPDPASV